MSDNAAPTPNDLANAAQAHDSVPGEGRGFPADTPLAEMTVEQQAAYWKFQARKHEQRVKERADYDQLKKKAAELDAKMAAEMGEHEKALKAAREEGYAAAKADANAEAATAMLRAALAARGVKNSEISDILEFTNTSALVKDGDLDGDKILAYASRLAGKPDAGEDNYPDMGQGQRGNAPRQSAREAAKAVARQRGLVSADA